VEVRKEPLNENSLTEGLNFSSRTSEKEKAKTGNEMKQMTNETSLKLRSDQESKNLLQPLGQVSISPTFFARFFRMNVLFSSYVSLRGAKISY